MMKHTISSKELPPELQPYERCIKEGPAALNDAELLAVILRCGSRGENSVALAQRLLSFRPLSELITLSVPQLTKMKGIGPVKAIQIQCVGELSQRIAKKNHVLSETLSSPEQIAGFFMEELCRCGKEKVILVLMNTKCQVIHHTLLSVGTVNSSLLSPREVFLEAMRYEAVHVILVHNHPSGDPTPSDEDIAVTRQIAEAGCLVSVTLLDHVIIGDHTFISLKERGYF